MSIFEYILSIYHELYIEGYVFVCLLCVLWLSLMRSNVGKHTAVCSWKFKCSFYALSREKSKLFCHSC